MAHPWPYRDEYAGREIHEVRLVSLLGQWLWRVDAADGVELRGADGRPFSLDEGMVTRMAEEC